MNRVQITKKLIIKIKHITALPVRGFKIASILDLNLDKHFTLFFGFT